MDFRPVATLVAHSSTASIEHFQRRVNLDNAALGMTDTPNYVTDVFTAAPHRLPPDSAAAGSRRLPGRHGADSHHVQHTRAPREPPPQPHAAAGERPVPRRGRRLVRPPSAGAEPRAGGAAGGQHHRLRPSGHPRCAQRLGPHHEGADHRAVRRRGWVRERCGVGQRVARGGGTGGVGGAGTITATAAGSTASGTDHGLS